jgi:hypothetical protein
LVIMLTAALCAPVLCAGRIALQGRTRVAADVAIILSALALGSTLLAGLTPVVLLAHVFDAPYHRLTLMVVGCCLVSGAAGGAFFLRALFHRAGRGRAWIAMTLGTRTHRSEPTSTLLSVRLHLYPVLILPRRHLQLGAGRE